MKGYSCKKKTHFSSIEHIQSVESFFLKYIDVFPSDNIYELFREVLNNSVEELYVSKGHIEVTYINYYRISLRDTGRGIPLENLIECVTSTKTNHYELKPNHVLGNHGAGVKIVNAFSSYFEIRSYQNGLVRTAIFENGILKDDITSPTQEVDGTYVLFEPNAELFNNGFNKSLIEEMLHNYCYLNKWLTIIYNGTTIKAPNGLKDLLNDRISDEALYPIIHLSGDNIEIAFTHVNKQHKRILSYVNGYQTIDGGTHQAAFEKHFIKAIKELFYIHQSKDIILKGLEAAISIWIGIVVFENAKKGELSSTKISPDGETIDKYIGAFIKESLKTYFSSHPDVAEMIKKSILKYPE